MKFLLPALTLAAALAMPRALPAQTPASFGAVAPAMQAFVDRGEIAGVVTLVATRDKILHIGATGQSNVAPPRRMRADDVFWVASMSKPITAVAVAMLVDDGKLSFDDPIAKYLPEFNGASPAITLRRVLTHTAGLGELTERRPHLTLAETSREVAKLPLRFDPGARWGYSTAGFDLLGRVVEVASGMAFDRFLQTRLFDPLEMKEAGLFSTAADIARFYQMMLGEGAWNGRRILKRETVAEMIRPQTGELAARPGMPWGLGFSIVENPAAMEANKVLSPHAFGHGGAFSTQSWADPARGLIWAVMFQRTGKGNPDNSDVRIAFQDAVPAGGR